MTLPATLGRRVPIKLPSLSGVLKTSLTTVLYVTTAASVCVAQTAGGWTSLFPPGGHGQSIPTDSLYTCFPEATRPDSITLRTNNRPAGSQIGDIWIVYGAGGVWQSLNSPGGNSPLTVRVIGFSCPAGPSIKPSVLIERDGHIARLAGFGFASADQILAGNLGDTSSIGFTVERRPRPVAEVRRDCGDSTCFLGLTSVGPLLDSIQRAKASAAAAEAQAKARRAAAAVATKTARDARRRAEGWTDEQIALVDSRKIQIGMTGAMVRAAWGPPERINTTTTASGQDEQWVYGSGSYVYFGPDGVVRSIQTSR